MKVPARHQSHGEGSKVAPCRRARAALRGSQAVGIADTYIEREIV